MSLRRGVARRSVREMVDQWVWPVGEMRSTAVGDSDSDSDSGLLLLLLLLRLLWWWRLDFVRERFRFSVHFGVVPVVLVSW